MKRVECDNRDEKKDMKEISRCIFFNDTAATEIYTLSLHDALPIWQISLKVILKFLRSELFDQRDRFFDLTTCDRQVNVLTDRKSTRLNSSHANISYAVFCLKKKKSHPSHLSPFIFLSNYQLSSFLS